MALEDRIAQWSQQAAELVGADLFDYFAGGSGSETSLGEATDAWRSHRFRPRVLRDVATVDTSASVPGTELAAPLVVAPSASQGLLHPDGELATARAVARTGTLMIVSTRASQPIEQIAATGAPWWLQVYVTRERAVTAGLVERAAAAGASALVLTGDTPYVGRKARTGRPLPLADPAALVNLGRHLPAGADPATATDQDPSTGLAEIGWLAGLSGLPVLVKGVLRADDAKACLDAGAAGLIVSNHGGRQLDRAVPSAFALPEVVSAAGGAPVLVDGGIRSAADVLTALALGARAVGLGRPVLWALAVGGETVVETLLRELGDELAHLMALAGASSTVQLTPDLVVRPRSG